MFEVIKLSAFASRYMSKEIPEDAFQRPGLARVGNRSRHQGVLRTDSHETPLQRQATSSFVDFTSEF